MIVGTWSRRDLLHGVGAVEIDYYKLIDIIRKIFHRVYLVSLRVVLLKPYFLKRLA